MILKLPPTDEGVVAIHGLRGTIARNARDMLWLGATTSEREMRILLVSSRRSSPGLGILAVATVQKPFGVVVSSENGF